MTKVVPPVCNVKVTVSNNPEENLKFHQLVLLLSHEQTNVREESGSLKVMQAAGERAGVRDASSGKHHSLCHVVVLTVTQKPGQLQSS